MRKARKATPLTLAANMLKEARQSTKADIERARQNLAALDSSKIAVQLLAAVLFDRTKGLDHYAYMSVYGGVPQINFSIANASGFTDPQIVDTLDFLTREFSDVTSSESAEYLYRNYRFARNDMRVDFSVSVRSDSATCQRIEVGEETVIRKKYEMVCNG